MTEPRTEAGRALLGQVLGKRIAPESIAAIEAEATAAAEQRLRRDPWRCPKCGEPLHGTDVEHAPSSAAPRQGEPVDGLAEPETTAINDGRDYEWSALSQALDRTDDVMTSRGHRLASYSNEEYAAALRAALSEPAEP